MYIPSPSDTVVLNFGRNEDSDSGDDVWNGSAAYPFPTASATTTVVSSDAADDDGSTGATQVTVEGLDANWALTTEVVTMNGTTPVELVTDLIRVNRVYVTGVGSGGANAGTIQVKHSSTVLAHIAIGEGESLSAIYSTPASTKSYITGWSAANDGSASAKLALQVKDFGGMWRTKDVILLDDANSQASKSYAAHILAPKSDIRVRILTGVSAMDIVSQVDVALRAYGA